MGKLGVALLALACGCLALYMNLRTQFGSDFGFSESGLTISRERAAFVDIRKNYTSDDLASVISEAIDAGDVELANQYSALAGKSALRLPKTTLSRLKSANSLSAGAWRTGKACAGQTLARDADTPLEILCRFGADIAGIGDVRDIANESWASLTGADPDEVTLVLAAIGLAATVATPTTGGSAAPLAFGASFLKVLRKMPIPKSLRLEIDQSVVALMTKAEVVKIKNARPGRSMLEQVAARVENSRIVPVFKNIRKIAQATKGAVIGKGAAETALLLKNANSFDEIESIADMAATFGSDTRAVVKLTGKKSLRDFAKAVPLITVLSQAALGFAAFLTSLGLFFIIAFGAGGTTMRLAGVSLLAAAAFGMAHLGAQGRLKPSELAALWNSLPFVEARR